MELLDWLFVCISKAIDLAPDEKEGTYYTQLYLCLMDTSPDVNPYRNALRQLQIFPLQPSNPLLHGRIVGLLKEGEACYA